MKSENKIYEKLYNKEATSKAATTEFLRKIPNRKKLSNKDFNLCNTETSLDDIIKSILKQITMVLMQYFINNFQMN